MYTWNLFSGYEIIEQDWLNKHYQIIIEAATKVPQSASKPKLKLSPPEEKSALGYQFLLTEIRRLHSERMGKTSITEEVDYCYCHKLSNLNNAFGTDCWISNRLDRFTLKCDGENLDNKAAGDQPSNISG